MTDYMKTCLYDRHRSLGAKMVDFSGWEMPIEYAGIIQENLTVRQKVGVFDVSHMARILIEGPEAENFLDKLSTNKILGKKDLTATYTVWCAEDGGCIDDVIVYKRNPEQFFVIVNASNREKDLEHLKKEARSFQVIIHPLFSDGILAVQGPQSLPLMQKIFPEAIDLKPMHFLPLQYKQKEIILSATGYTGAGGFEIYGPSDCVVDLWDRLLSEGHSFGIRPIGLGARDTLRLEKGYALYGHELSRDIKASESVSAWTIKWDKSRFLGKEALEELENSSKKRHEYGIWLKEPGIAREGYTIFKEGKAIGKVISGTFSPSLRNAIAIILADEKINIGEIIEVQIRQKLIKAKVVALPFL
jgi:aminomethyltransferase